MHNIESRRIIDEPFVRYCVGQSARDLVVPQLRLEGGEYYLAVMQDREQYTEDPPPPVLENVSDTYELSLAPADAEPDLEVEPNDTLNWPAMKSEIIEAAPRYGTGDVSKPASRRKYSITRCDEVPLPP